MFGGSDTPLWAPGHAFLWQDGALLDLNDLLPAAAGWHLRTAADVNDAGHVVAVGVGAIGDSEHAFLLSPLAPGGLPRTGGAAA